VRSLKPLAILSALLLIVCANTSIAHIESDNHSYQLIKLSQKAEQSVENTFSVTKTINRDDDGSMKLKKSYVVLDGHIVKTDLEFKIKKYSFSGDADITTTVDKFTPPLCSLPIWEKINANNLS